MNTLNYVKNYAKAKLQRKSRKKEWQSLGSSIISEAYRVGEMEGEEIEDGGNGNGDEDGKVRNNEGELIRQRGGGSGGGGREARRNGVESSHENRQNTEGVGQPGEEE